MSIMYYVINVKVIYRMIHSKDGHGPGTITNNSGDGRFSVKWDKTGCDNFWYPMGYEGSYILTLAESISKEEKKRAGEEKAAAIRKNAG